MDGAALIWPAFGLLAFGGVLQLIGWHRGALARALGTAPPGPPHLMTHTGRVMIHTGRVRPLAELVGPLSGEKCAWFRVDVRQNPGSRGPTAHYRWDEPASFAVGGVEVAARLLDRHLYEEDIHAGLAAGLLKWHDVPEGRCRDEVARLQAAGMRIRDRRGDFYRITEYRLPVDQPITVLGRPRHTGHGLMLTTGGVACGVSERPVEELRAAARAEAATTRLLPRVLLAAGAVVLVVSLLLRLAH
ncbi:hypothetical protein [Paractinoplanes rishiriensis]|uniref:Uncharacterized protein n=1 Tax=Paractinoplanes rishiriensis TaxID=1050105 RepID=A0A919N168_9ACTN|nr:hypothetical protein [Actinoplanes rishiriensis]GIF00671.1 hypothetical protein Ari01nite_81350 [Actinoplanes rishiriensis]